MTPYSEHPTAADDCPKCGERSDWYDESESYTIEWKPGSEPNIPPVGPSDWRGDPGRKSKSKPMTVMDVIKNVTGQNG